MLEGKHDERVENGEPRRERETTLDALGKRAVKVSVWWGDHLVRGARAVRDARERTSTHFAEGFKSRLVMIGVR